MTDMDSTLASEAKAEDAVESEEIPGGVQTTDPTFAGGAMEVDSTPWNPPAEEEAEEAEDEEAEEPDEDEG